MGLAGLEPATSRLSGVRSNRLSYKPSMVEVEGLEPPAPWSQTTCATKLRYTSIMAGAAGFEPTAFGFGDQRSTAELRPY